jgi:PKD repeat protein
MPLRHNLTVFRARSFLSARIVACPLTIGFLVMACGGSDLVLPGSGGGTAIRVVEGDGQTGVVGGPLPAPVVVEVTGETGNPVEGASVQFALTSAGAGGEIAPATAVTSALGRAEAQVLLGDKVGLQTGEARLVHRDGASVAATFSAAAMRDDNRPPDADFDWQCDLLTCRFSDHSRDQDGSVTAWTWRFGDGTTSTGREPTHRYDEAGTYAVTLTVTDDGGAEDDASEQVTAAAPSEPPSNAPPRADFELTCTQLRCTFSDRSTDSDGRVAGRQWTFGDGAGSSDRNPSHEYAAPGRYEVRLVVTDDDGAEDDRTRTAQAEAPPEPPEPPNDPPQADFQVECQALQCLFVDRSEDADGAVESWRWDFGDGATSTERNPSHSYAVGGRYDVALLVTDDDGAADSRIHPAEPKAPEPNKPPSADFKVHCARLTCTFTDRSKDDDGTIVERRWDFGEGATSGEQNPVHTYLDDGRFDAALTVTDDDGATATKTHRVDAKK